MAIGKFSTLSSSSIKEDKPYEQKPEVQKEDVRRQRRQQQQPNKLQKTTILYLSIVVILAASVAISSLFLVLPASVIDDYSIHRPYEIPSLVLFMVRYLFFLFFHSW